jgi:hypothetical protein
MGANLELISKYKKIDGCFKKTIEEIPDHHSTLIQQMFMEHFQCGSPVFGIGAT